MVHPRERRGLAGSSAHARGAARRLAHAPRGRAHNLRATRRAHATANYRRHFIQSALHYILLFQLKSKFLLVSSSYNAELRKKHKRENYTGNQRSQNHSLKIQIINSHSYLIDQAVNIHMKKVSQRNTLIFHNLLPIFSLSYYYGLTIKTFHCLTV